jgi:hypothetical protein
VLTTENYKTAQVERTYNTINYIAIILIQSFVWQEDKSTEVMTSQLMANNNFLDIFNKKSFF